MINVTFNKEQPKTTGERLELIPFRVAHDGEARVSDYFHCKTEQLENGNYENYLFGRKLKGRSYQGDGKKSGLNSIPGSKRTEWEGRAQYDIQGVGGQCGLAVG